MAPSFSHCFSIGICAWIFSSCSSFIVVDFGFCGNKLFKVNTEVCCSNSVLCGHSLVFNAFWRSLSVFHVAYKEVSPCFLYTVIIITTNNRTLLLNVPDRSFTERLFCWTQLILHWYNLENIENDKQIHAFSSLSSFLFCQTSKLIVMIQLTFCQHAPMKHKSYKNI